MEPEISLPYSQVPATCPYPEPTPSAAFPLPHNRTQERFWKRKKICVAAHSIITTCDPIIPAEKHAEPISTGKTAVELSFDTVGLDILQYIDIDIEHRNVAPLAEQCHN
jgi:hypothetical protein